MSTLLVKEIENLGFASFSEGGKGRVFSLLVIIVVG